MDTERDALNAARWIAVGHGSATRPSPHASTMACTGSGMSDQASARTDARRAVRGSQGRSGAQ